MKLTHWLIKVAMAAPEMPRLSLKIKMGSSAILRIPPKPSPMVERTALPSERDVKHDGGAHDGGADKDIFCVVGGEGFDSRGCAEEFHKLIGKG